MNDPNPSQSVASTGNDIVDLSATDPVRTCTNRFYSRIISGEEKTLYDQLRELPFDQYIWLLWSIKESVYKYISRTDTGLVFAPLTIPILHLVPPSGDGLYKSMIIYGSEILYSRSIVTNQLIVTVVSNEENFDRTWWGFRPIDEDGYADQSAAVRTFALGKLHSALLRTDLRIEKSFAGYPIVVDGKGPLDIPLSLAHHGHFVAYSYRLPPDPPVPSSRSAILKLAVLFPNNSLNRKSAAN